MLHCKICIHQMILSEICAAFSVLNRAAVAQNVE